MRGCAGYEASTAGRIRSAKTKRVKKPSANKSGYLVVCLRDDDARQRVVKVHRLVAGAFVPEFDIDDPSHEVDHIDRNKANNCPDNLRLADRIVQSTNRDHTNAARGKRFPVEQVNKTNGQVVRVHESVNAAARAVGGEAGNICNVLNGKAKSAYGWAWRYVAHDLSDLPGEEWRPFEGVHVSNKGRIKRPTVAGPRIQEVTVHSKKSGYPCTMINRTDWPVHKLVAHVFLGATDEDRIHHKDGDYMNPSSDNLEIASRKRIAEAAEERGRARHKIGVAQYGADGQLVRAYASAAEASRATGVGASFISKCARGTFPTAGGFVWRHA